MNGAPLGLAFVGLGWWGGVLAEAANASGAVRVTGGFARTPATRAEFVEKYGGRNFASLDEVLADPETEAVAVVSANSVHKEQAIAAARAGKHVHLEKPMALSVSDAKEIVAACAEAKVKLQVGQNFRRWPMFRRAKELIDSGRLGTPSLALCRFSNDLGFTAGPESMRWDPVQNPGGPLYSYTIHMADLAEHLFGEVEEVQAAFGKVGGPAPVDDVAAGLLKFRGGMVAVLAGSYVSPFLFGFEIQGTEANLTLSDARMPELQPKGSRGEDAETLDVGGGFIEGRDIANAEQFADLARCVREGGEPEVGGTQGVRALAIMRAMLKSRDEGRPVTIEEMLEND
ncbi:MAG: Gfo/Idh/MocA family oxidoreductase [bacterium]